MTKSGISRRLVFVISVCLISIIGCEKSNKANKGGDTVTVDRFWSDFPVLDTAACVDLAAIPNYDQHFDPIPDSIKIVHRIELKVGEKKWQKIQIARQIDNPKPSEYERVKYLRSEELSLGGKSAKMKIDGLDVEVKNINIRGKTSFNHDRKPFSVNLDTAFIFNHLGAKKAIKKFKLISLNRDQSYFKNKVAFGMMKELDLFPLFHQFVEFVVNGETQGIYLLIQSADEYAEKDAESPFFFRRRHMANISNEAFNEEFAKKEESFYADRYQDIYKDIKKLKGQKLYQYLDERLDMKKYFSWMAFNLLIGNHDYADEIYLYYSKSQPSKMIIIPWDYDDVFYNTPHEGFKDRSKKYADRLSFSLEDDLDVQITKDDYCYNQYLGVLTDLLSKMNDERIRAAFQNAYHELGPYYANPEITDWSATDKHGLTNPERLACEMNMSFEYVVARRKAILDYMAK